jgi:hypothetical protein
MTTEPITAANYVERARAFVRAKGAGGEGFVIRAYRGAKGSLETKLAATPGPWAAWMGYLTGKGMPTAFAVDQGMMTVPAEWPDEFDALWFNERPPPLEPPRLEFVSLDRRRELASMLSATAAGWGPSERPRARPTQSRSLDELAREYAATPPAMGAAWVKQTRKPVEVEVADDDIQF